MNCSLSTDDPTIFQNNLEMEYKKCQKRFNVSTKKLLESNLNAARASFLPDDEKEDLVKSLQNQFALVSFDSFWKFLKLAELTVKLFKAKKDKIVNENFTVTACTYDSK